MPFQKKPNMEKEEALRDYPDVHKLSKSNNSILSDIKSLMSDTRTFSGSTPSGPPFNQVARIYDPTKNPPSATPEKPKKPVVVVETPPPLEALRVALETIQAMKKELAALQRDSAGKDDPESPASDV